MDHRRLRAPSRPALADGRDVVPAYERALVNKEPMKFKLFADVIPVSPLNLYVIEKAPHPNAGRLFAAWFRRKVCRWPSRSSRCQAPLIANSRLSKLLKAQSRRPREDRQAHDRQGHRRPRGAAQGHAAATDGPECKLSAN
jgi:hypothetical protein